MHPRLQEVHLPLVLDRRAGVRAAQGPPLGLELVHFREGDEVQGDQLHRRVQAVGVLPLVVGVEVLDDLVHLDRGDGAAGQVDLRGVLLVLVAQPAVAQETNPLGLDTLGRVLRQGPLLQPGEGHAEGTGRLRPGKLHDAGLQVVPAQVAEEHAPGGENPRMVGDDDLPDAQLPGQLAGVHAPAAAEGHQGELPGIVAPVHGDELDGVDHVVVGQAHDAPGHLPLADAQLTRQAVQGPIHGGHVRGEGAAAEVVGVDAPQGQVGVGGGGFPAAQAVGHGPGIRARALGPHVQALELVHPGDGAATLADLHQIHHRHHDRVAGGGGAALHQVVAVQLHLAAGDEPALGRGAADVDGDDLRLVDEAPQRGRAPDAAGRAGLDHGDGDLAGVLDRVHAAVGLHDVGRAGHASLGQATGEPVQVAVGQGLDVGRHDRGVGPLVLPPLPGDLVGGHGRHLGPELLDPGQEGLFMSRVGVGVEQADGHGLHPLRPEILQDGGQAGEVQGGGLLAFVVDAAWRLPAQVAVHEGPGLLVLQVEEVGPVASADLQHVPEALGGDQGGLGPLALGDGVDDQGGAMDEGRELPGLDPCGLDHVHDALLELAGRGVALGRAHLAVLGDVDQIGEGAANIRRDAHYACSSLLSLARISPMRKMGSFSIFRFSCSRSRAAGSKKSRRKLSMSGQSAVVMKR